MTGQWMLTEFSRTGIEQKIDDFLAEKKLYQAISLILPVAGSATRFNYRGLNVREWHCGNNVRFDSAVEVFD